MVPYELHGPVELMKDKYYSYYERLMSKTTQRPITETFVYQSLHQRYPHIAESIRLRKERERLGQEWRSTKDRSARRKLAREIEIINASLKREEFVKRLHGEGALERRYCIRLAIQSGARRVSRLVTGKRKARGGFIQRIKSKLPPSLLDLRSLDQVDRGFALKQWVNRKWIEKPKTPISY